MILFVLIAIGILIYTIFANDWLIFHIKKDIKDPYRSFSKTLEDIGIWFLFNILFNALNWILVFVVSMIMLVVLNNTCPKEMSEWEFSINALQDNLVTEGEFYGRRGHVDGELSYFYSRTLAYGEKIEHIPASKTYVKYSDTEHPHVEVHQRRIDIPDWMYKVFFLEMMNGKTTDYYVIVVPEGTITSTGQYNIDME